MALGRRLGPGKGYGPSVVLIGHSYGGMVATDVADRARERVVQLIYLDAFVPEDGERQALQSCACEFSDDAVNSGEGRNQL